MSFQRCNRNITTLDEENPKTIPLVKLVHLIEPNILAYYLDQVCIFLKNNKKDLWFPLISPNLEAFLVRMIQNTQNLKNLLHVLDDKNKELALDIIETIEANKNVYTVVHNYSNSNVSKNILVYRKVIEKKLPDVATVINQLERLCPTKIRCPSRVMDDKTDQVARKPPDKESTITQKFKIHWVNATLSFIEDNTADCLEYPDMNVEQSEYVYSLVKPGRVDVDADLSMKDVYKPLKEALKELKKSQELKSTFTYLCENRVRLALEKVPLTNNRAQAKKGETNENSISPENENAPKSAQRLARKTETIKLLEPSFIRTILHMTLDFMCQETDTSIVFRNADDKQCLFLQSLKATAKTKKLYDTFSDESRDLLRKIATRLANESYDLKIDLAKMEKNSSFRTVTYIKVPKEKPRGPSPIPCFAAAQSQNRSPSEDTESPSWQEENKNPTPSTDKNTSQHADTKKVKLKETTDNINTKKEHIEKPIIIEKKVDNQKDSTNTKLEQTIETTTKNQDQAIDNTKDASTPNICIENGPKTIDNVKDTEKSTIDNQIPADTAVKVVDKTAEQVKTTNNKIIVTVQTKRQNGLGLRKTRLIEGLSTPLESDVAMRMMRQMGWEGGPLGTRGEGVMEPVIPAIHLKAGAGLGHVPPVPPKKVPKTPKPTKSLPPKIVPQNTPEPQDPPPQQSRLSRTIHCHKPPNIRLDILRHIHHLIIEDPLERVVVYSTKLAKKEMKFLENTIKVIGRKGALIFNDNDMQDVYGRIIDEVTAEPKLQLSCVVGNDKKLVISKNDISPKTVLPPTQPQPLKSTSNQVPQITPQLDNTSFDPAVESVLSITSKYMTASYITPEIITKLGQQLAPTRSNKAIKYVGHNVIILASILNLLQSPNTEKVVKFDYPITCKKVKYIREVLTGIRDRKRWPYSTRHEHFLSVKILGATDHDVYVSAVYLCNNQHITFKKIVQPRSNNKTESLEPTTPETTELNENKNAIAKVNGTVDDKNDAKTASSNEVIVISDSDNESVKNEALNDVKTDVINLDSSPNTSLVSELETKFVNGDKENAKDSNKKSAEEAEDGIKMVACSNGAISKRPRSNSDESDKSDKTKVNIKYLGIAPEGYPMENVGVDDIISFQNKVSEKLENSKHQPLLECLGIKNGAIIYCCYNELGTKLIENAAKEMKLNTINITNLYKKQPYKMNARINSYVEINLKNLFKKVETYNFGLDTNLWNVIDVKPSDGYIALSMEMDEHSFEYISRNNFSIFAGIDKMRFSVAWD